MAQMQLKMTRFSAPVRERTLPKGCRFQFFDGSEREIGHATRWNAVRAALSYPAVTYVAEDALAKEEE